MISPHYQKGPFGRPAHPLGGHHHPIHRRALVEHPFFRFYFRSLHKAFALIPLYIAFITHSVTVPLSHRTIRRSRIAIIAIDKDSQSNIHHRHCKVERIILSVAYTINHAPQCIIMCVIYNLSSAAFLVICLENW